MMQAMEELLLGPYQGIPLTERTRDDGMVLPDTITLYRECIAEVCDTQEKPGVRHFIWQVEDDAVDLYYATLP